jgi:hypothetical protein
MLRPDDLLAFLAMTLSWECTSMIRSERPTLSSCPHAFSPKPPLLPVTTGPGRAIELKAGRGLRYAKDWPRMPDKVDS